MRLLSNPGSAATFLKSKGFVVQMETNVRALQMWLTGRRYQNKEETRRRIRLGKKTDTQNELPGWGDFKRSNDGD